MKSYRQKPDSLVATQFEGGADNAAPIIEMFRMAGLTAVFVGAVEEVRDDDGSLRFPARPDRIAFWREDDRGYFVSMVDAGMYVFTYDGVNFSTSSKERFEDNYEAELVYDENTLQKVYDAMETNGIWNAQARDVVNSLLNAGILFRERQ